MLNLNFINYDNWLSDDGCEEEDDDQEEVNELNEDDEADYKYDEWVDSQYD